MATRIIEYESSGRLDRLPTVPKSAVVQPAMTATGVSANSIAVGAYTVMVCVQSDEAIFVARGPTPTATTDNIKVWAGSEAFFDVAGGDKVAIRT